MTTTALGAAAFSPCGNYRWWLERRWGQGDGRLLFIGLNPSRAGADQDDPTLRRLMGFARGWDYEALEVVNLFARITSSPSVLKRPDQPVGAENDRWIEERLGACDAVWLGWGNGGLWRDRHLAVLQLMDAKASGKPVGCIGRTNAGQPRHPLYTPGATAWRPWAEPANLSHPVAT
ncbi:DUF1643 domain-containing protein [Synechococcus sp. FGCU-3]|nr:DUF1643 domain-containing protein [Synechococcus sp. FGCU3]